MGLPKFTCLAPSDIKEACSYLEEHEGQIAILAGGTDLVMRLKHRIETPAYLLSLRKMNGLNSIEYDPDTGFKLGTRCSLTNIALNPRVKSELPALARAAEEVASPQIRNRGTIGGNVCLDTREEEYTVSRHRHPMNISLKIGARKDGKLVLFDARNVVDNGAYNSSGMAFIEHGAIQCGFCTPGMVLSASALLRNSPAPTVEEIKRSISGNLCRCTGYLKIGEAIHSAAQETYRKSGPTQTGNSERS